MQPGVLLLLICLLVIALTTILCISFYFNRMRVWVRVDDEHDGHLHGHCRPRWVRSRNYQTLAQSDLEQGNDTSDYDDDGAPGNSQQTLPPPPTRCGGPGRRSGLPKSPAPRAMYNYCNWDPEGGVIGVTYKQQSRADEEHGRILDEETARRIEEHERHMDDPSPHNLDRARARGGSSPISIPTKRTKRPTFPVPPKLIWQKLTPFEKAGPVWWRN
ncbi:hypothetical protein PISL3812_00746 [Talaromyces islandicus]|uniref:Uncharacterized protein n=1 Tax=Talaromyces islandicus TaxID=28573 RepID=A0A0U1LKB3_TALIS|nr:hypothetical protein PISL3812_00746 [Talaromyces islandicus]